MSTLSLLTDKELDAVSGGFLSFNVVGFSIQTNLSSTRQSQVNLTGVSLLSAQGGAQVAQTAQNNSIG